MCKQQCRGLGLVTGRTSWEIADKQRWEQDQASQLRRQLSGMWILSPHTIPEAGVGWLPKWVLWSCPQYAHCLGPACLPLTSAPESPFV